jgi:peptidylprolyl isomerase
LIRHERHDAAAREPFCIVQELRALGAVRIAEAVHEEDRRHRVALVLRMNERRRDGRVARAISDLVDTNPTGHEPRILRRHFERRVPIVIEREVPRERGGRRKGEEEHEDRELPYHASCLTRTAYDACAAARREARLPLARRAHSMKFPFSHLMKRISLLVLLASLPGAVFAAPATSKTVVLPDGLKYVDLKVGKGALPHEGQTVRVHYVGWLENGMKFDSSRDRNEPFEFALGEGKVIPGWDEGVKTMHVGGLRRLIVPPALGYGAQGAGDSIPPNATLIFEVELLGIE